MVLGVLTGWLDRREREAVAYLIDRSRILRRPLGSQRLRLTDDDRRRLAARAYRVGRAVVREIATIAPPDTWLRWHRPLIAHTWTYVRRAGRLGIMLEIQRLVGADGGGESDLGLHTDPRRAENVGHRMGRSTTRRLLQAAGWPPVPRRPTSWHTFLQAHWGVIAGADVFTTEVWTWRGVVTYSTVFVI
jgi:hypothetical protein